MRVTKTKSPLKLFIQNEVLMDPTNMDDEWFERQRQALLHDDIKVMLEYPSATEALAKFCRSKGDVPQAFSLRGAMTAAESLYENTRKTIQEVFGCRVLSRYCTEEFGTLAMERPEDNKHLLNLATFVIELLALNDDTPVGPGELGRIVVTDLFSHAMPLIRFDTGDLAVLAKGALDEKNWPLLERIEGRQVETVYNTKGTRMSPFAINGAMRDLEGVIQFQFIQNSKTDYTIKLITLPSFEQEQIILHRMISLLGDDANIRIEYVFSIPPSRSGKRPYIINESARSPESWQSGF